VGGQWRKRGNLKAIPTCPSSRFAEDTKREGEEEEKTRRMDACNTYVI